MPNNLFWAGSDTSYQRYLAAVEKFAALSPEAYGSEISSEEEVEVPRLYSTLGNVGVITISGALINHESWWTRWAGMTSYESIREALIYAVEDSSVDKILLDISSPGGQVAGCEDCANLVSEVSKHKQVTAYSDATVASAAYWIGSAAERRFSSKTAIWGSIGVIMTHTEVSKMRTEAGITDTVFRSGPWKGIGGSDEKLSDLAKKDFQEKTDYLAEIFVDSVAENLNITAAFVDETMGKGREFVGQQAVDVGLCNGIKSFDAVISKLQETEEPVGGINMSKKSLTPQAIAAMAAGATPEAESSSVAATAEGKEVKVDTDVTTEGAEATTETPDAEGESPETETGADDGASLTSALAKVELLTEQLATATSENVALKLEAGNLEKRADAIEPLKIIAASAVNNMQVAMGSASTDLTKHAASDIVALYEATAGTFESTFKVEGVAAEASLGSEPPELSFDEIDNVGSVGL